MLAALEESVGRQRRLVADASHELRTPLTSTRTNIDLLREGRLPADEAKHALDERVDRARGAYDARLGSGRARAGRGAQVAGRGRAARRSRRRSGRAREGPALPQATFVTSLSPTVVRADPILLERAVSNLLDNAVKYSPPGAPIEVTVREGEVIVADHGPGVAEEDCRADLRPLLPRGSRTFEARRRARAGDRARGGEGARRRRDGRELGERRELPAHPAGRGLACFEARRSESRRRDSRPVRSTTPPRPAAGRRPNGTSRAANHPKKSHFLRTSVRTPFGWLPPGVTK